MLHMKRFDEFYSTSKSVYREQNQTFVLFTRKMAHPISWFSSFIHLEHNQNSQVMTNNLTVDVLTILTINLSFFLQKKFLVWILRFIQTPEFRSHRRLSNILRKIITYKVLKTDYRTTKPAVKRLQRSGRYI